MKSSKLPQIDSVEELARFWDTHDLTDFEDDLEETTPPVFVRGDSIQLHLRSSEAKAIRKLAASKGVSQGELIRQWVIQKLVRRKKSSQAKG